MKALVTAPFDERGLERLRAQMEVVYEPWTVTGVINRGEEFAERITRDGFDVLVVETDLVHDEAFETEQLKIVGVCRGDPLTVDLDEANDREVPVFFAPGRNAPAVADHTLALMLALTRRLAECDRRIRRDGFSLESFGDLCAFYEQIRGGELGGKTVGLLGFGAIGVEVAKRLAGFGATVRAFDPHAPSERFAAHGVARVDDFASLIAGADVVSIHCAESKETRRLFDAEAFAAMKRGALLINTARHSIVDEEALHQALQSGRLGGAGLDVTKVEPLRADDPLLAVENVIVTPHIAGASREVIERHSAMVGGDIELWLKGERPRHCLNPEVFPDRFPETSPA